MGLHHKSCLSPSTRRPIMIYACDGFLLLSQGQRLLFLSPNHSESPSVPKHHQGLLPLPQHLQTLIFGAGEFRQTTCCPLPIVSIALLQTTALKESPSSLSPLGFFLSSRWRSMEKGLQVGALSLCLQPLGDLYSHTIPHLVFTLRPLHKSLANH